MIIYRIFTVYRTIGWIHTIYGNSFLGSSYPEWSKGIRDLVLSHLAYNAAISLLRIILENYVSFAIIHCIDLFSVNTVIALQFYFINKWSYDISRNRTFHQAYQFNSYFILLRNQLQIISMYANFFESNNSEFHYWKQLFNFLLLLCYEMPKWLRSLNERLDKSSIRITSAK